MSTSFENPFIPKPDNLKPDSAEFLGKFAKASDEQLRKAGVTKSHVEEEVPKSVDEDKVSQLKEASTEEEQEAYLNEIVNWDASYYMKRRDADRLQKLKDIIFKNIEARGEPLPNTVLGWGIGNITIRQGNVIRLELNGTDIPPLADIEFPQNLKQLRCFDTLNAFPDNAIFPETLEDLYLHDFPGLKSLDNVKLPKNLTELSIGYSGVSSLDNVELPQTLQKILIEGTPLADDKEAVEKLQKRLPKCRIK